MLALRRDLPDLYRSAAVGAKVDPTAVTGPLGRTGELGLLSQLCRLATSAVDDEEALDCGDARSAHIRDPLTIRRPCREGGPRTDLSQFVEVRAIEAGNPERIGAVAVGAESDILSIRRDASPDLT